MIENTGKIVWLAGASGMVGSRLLECLLPAVEYSRITAITRRPLGRESQRLANRIVPFSQLEAQLKGQACDTAVCCLGASYREAGSEAAYREAAQHTVLAFARAAKAAGARRFVMLSCQAAKSDSRRPAERVQGETLDALCALGFESLDILLPGPLLGLRPGLKLAHLVSMTGAALLRPLQVGASERRRAIGASQVAAAMLGAMRSGRRGVYRYEFAGIQSLSRIRSRT
ncbi:MAG TPA: NAD-dependent epimerase/dehydratase family protein [Steroidobacteraceae bacterium]|nr:NAD-dependent epimerase/dehydratase family protein [Steroidobacteraceae bacterium]